MKKAFSFFLLILVYSCSSQYPKREPGSVTTNPDYPLIFKTTRDLLIPLSKNLKDVPESYVVDELQSNPELLSKLKEELVKELETFNKENYNPTIHTRLIPPPGSYGYTDLKLFVNHPYYLNQKLIEPHNLIEVWKRFILSAEKEVILNVFDFDLEDIAEALIQQSKKGLEVIVGIDKKSVIDVRPEVKLIHDKLIENGIKVTGVIPVGLNHQKITAIDWSLPEKAAVLFSSGNLTNSCLEPEGDLKGTVPLPIESVPNANHLLTMKSWLLSNLVHHELTKTLHPDYLL